MASTPKITTKLSRFQDALTPCVESALQHPCVKPIFLVWTTNYLAGLLPICHQSRRGQPAAAPLPPPMSWQKSRKKAGTTTTGIDSTRRVQYYV